MSTTIGIATRDDLAQSDASMESTVPQDEPMESAADHRAQKQTDQEVGRDLGFSRIIQDFAVDLSRKWTIQVMQREVDRSFDSVSWVSDTIRDIEKTIQLIESFESVICDAEKQMYQVQEQLEVIEDKTDVVEQLFQQSSSPAPFWFLTAAFLLSISQQIYSLLCNFSNHR